MHTQSFVSVPPHVQADGFKGPCVDCAGLLAEPNFMQCSPEFVKQKAGPIGQAVLKEMEDVYAYPIRLAKQEGLSAVVDIAVHKLLPRQYAAMPGWHCDAVPWNGYNGQPDFSLINPNSFIVSLQLSNEVRGVGDVQFVMDNIKPKLWDRDHVFKDLHAQVQRIPHNTVISKNGHFIRYWPKTILRALPCERRGVRLWFRYVMVYKPQLLNQLVNCQQVYLLSEEDGV